MSIIHVTQHINATPDDLKVAPVIRIIDMDYLDTIALVSLSKE